MGKRKGNGSDAAEQAPSEARSEVMELPLIVLPATHACTDCGECCTYLAVEIDQPTSFTDLEHVFWYLTHRDVAVYIDWEGDWFIEFQTVCEHLTEAKACGIYEERPKICSEFSWNECERTTGERAWKYHFDVPDQFFEWLEAKQPSRYEKYMKSRRKLLDARRAGVESAKETPPSERDEAGAGA